MFLSQSLHYHRLWSATYDYDVAMLYIQLQVISILMHSPPPFLQQPQALSRNTPHVFVSLFFFFFSFFSLFSTICKVTTQRSLCNFLSLFACVCMGAWQSLVCSVLICQSLFSFFSSVCGRKTLCKTLQKPMKQRSYMVTVCLTRFCWGLVLFSTYFVILS